MKLLSAFLTLLQDYRRPGGMIVTDAGSLVPHLSYRKLVLRTVLRDWIELAQDKD
jgi:hypothetical protein